jgi:hypothetical protein
MGRTTLVLLSFPHVLCGNPQMRKWITAPCLRGDNNIGYPGSKDALMSTSPLFELDSRLRGNDM